VLLSIVLVGARRCSADIQYVYDELNRLVAVIDASGETATYTYDAVGNMLAIGRGTTAQVAVLAFNPECAPVGATVTIAGTGFSGTPAQNTVRFNGTAGSVTSATPTQLTVTVPAGATSGAIGVTAPGGSASSPTAFTVGCAPPTITSFIPAVGTPTRGSTVGDTIAIGGTNFQATLPDNHIRTNITAASTDAMPNVTTILTHVPETATSGHLTVTTPYGEAVTTGDFFVAPSIYNPPPVQGAPVPPPYDYVRTDVAATGRMTIGGTMNVTIGSPGQIALIVFDGVVGQHVSALRQSSMCWRLTMIDPQGRERETAIGCPAGTSQLLEPVTLETSGTHTIAIDSPNQDSTGQVTLSLFDVVDGSTAIAPGSPPLDVSVAVPGQNPHLTFTGTAGQRVALQILPGSLPCCNNTVTIFEPNGGYLVEPVAVDGGVFLGPLTLPDDGTYTIVLDADVANMGDVTMTLTAGTAIPPVLIATEQLKMGDHTNPPAPQGRKFGFLAKTTEAAPANRIVLPARGSAGDPTLHGAVLSVYDTAGGPDAVTLALPATQWVASGTSGYKFKSASPLDPIRAVQLKTDLLKITGGKANWTYTLDEPTQGSVGVRLQLETGLVWCAQGGEPPTPPTEDRVDHFIVKRAPAPAVCP
jgi:YD repeat-containing protein